MVNCPECKTEMKMKGSATKGEGMIAVFYQCPKCKNIKIENKLRA